MISKVCAEVAALMVCWICSAESLFATDGICLTGLLRLILISIGSIITALLWSAVVAAGNMEANSEGNAEIAMRLNVWHACI